VRVGLGRFRVAEFGGGGLRFSDRKESGGNVQSQRGGLRYGLSKGSKEGAEEERQDRCHELMRTEKARKEDGGGQALKEGGGSVRGGAYPGGYLALQHDHRADAGAGAGVGGEQLALDGGGGAVPDPHGAVVGGGEGEATVGHDTADAQAEERRRQPSSRHAVVQQKVARHLSGGTGL
jgi:hypothetical protein